MKEKSSNGLFSKDIPKTLVSRKNKIKEMEVDIHAHCGGFVLCQHDWAGTPFPRTPIPGWFQVMLATKEASTRFVRWKWSNSWVDAYRIGVRVRHCCSSYTSSLVYSLSSPYWIISFSVSKFWVRCVGSVVKNTSLCYRSPTSLRLVRNRWINLSLLFPISHHFILAHRLPSDFCPNARRRSNHSI